jgi:hypothetical protein
MRNGLLLPVSRPITLGLPKVSELERFECFLLALRHFSAADLSETSFL